MQSRIAGARSLESHTWKIRSEFGTLGSWTSRSDSHDYDALCTLFSKIGTASAEEDALQAVHEYLSTDPANAEVLSIMACVTIRSDSESINALSIALSAARLAPLAPNVRYTLGMMYHIMQLTHSAIREWRTVQQMLPSGASVARLAAKMLNVVAGSSADMTNQRYHDANAADKLKDIIGKNDDDEHLRRAEAILGQTVDNGEKIVSVDLLLDICQFAPGPMLSLAQPRLVYEELADALLSLAEENPQDTWTRYNLSATFVGLNRRDEALYEAQRVLDLATAIDDSDVTISVSNLMELIRV